MTSGAPLRNAGSSSSGEIAASPRSTPLASAGAAALVGLASSLDEYAACPRIMNAPLASQRSSAAASLLVSRSKLPGLACSSSARSSTILYIAGASVTAWCTSSRTRCSATRSPAAVGSSTRSISTCIHDSVDAPGGTSALSSMSRISTSLPSASRVTTIWGCSTRSTACPRRPSSARTESTRYGASAVTMSIAVVAASMSTILISVSSTRRVAPKDMLSRASADSALGARPGSWLAA